MNPAFNGHQRNGSCQYDREIFKSASSLEEAIELVRSGRLQRKQSFSDFMAFFKSPKSARGSIRYGAFLGKSEDEIKDELIRNGYKIPSKFGPAYSEAKLWGPIARKFAQNIVATEIQKKKVHGKKKKNVFPDYDFDTAERRQKITIAFLQNMLSSEYQIKDVSRIACGYDIEIICPNGVIVAVEVKGPKAKLTSHEWKTGRRHSAYFVALVNEKTEKIALISYKSFIWRKIRTFSYDGKLDKKHLDNNESFLVLLNQGGKPNESSTSSRDEGMPTNDFLQKEHCSNFETEFESISNLR